MWKGNLGADVLFSPGVLGDNWLGAFDWFHTEDHAQPYWTNLRVQPAAAKAPDGRFMYQWTFDTTGGNNRPDPAGGGAQITGSDIGMGSADGGGSDILSATMQNRWDNTGYGDFGLTLGYTHSNVSDISPATSSTANSSYLNQAKINYNEAEVGTSDYERKHRFTISLDATEHWSEGQ